MSLQALLQFHNQSDYLNQIKTTFCHPTYPSFWLGQLKLKCLQSCSFTSSVFTLLSVLPAALFYCFTNNSLTFSVLNLRSVMFSAHHFFMLNRIKPVLWALKDICIFAKSEICQITPQLIDALSLCILSFFFSTVAQPCSTFKIFHILCKTFNHLSSTKLQKLSIEMCPHPKMLHLV